MSNTPNPGCCPCPRCHLRYATGPDLDAHFDTHPECRAYASIARSLVAIGAILCPRCLLAIGMTSIGVWTSQNGFVHQECATAEEREAQGCQTMQEIHEQATEASK